MMSISRQNNFLDSLRVLNQIGAAILAEHNVEEIIETVYHHLNQLVDAYSFAIGIYNRQTGMIDYIGARENNRKIPSFSVNAHMSDRFSGWVVMHEKEIMINNYKQEYQLYLPASITPIHGIEPASLMYVPIFIQKELTGILSVRTMKVSAYDEQSLEIMKTVAVFTGKAVENSRVSDKSTRHLPLPAAYKLNPLSAREIEVLNLMMKGWENKRIAQELFISASTVKTHTLRIYEKLDAANRTEAIVRAKAYGIIS